MSTPASIEQALAAALHAQTVGQAAGNVTVARGTLDGRAVHLARVENRFASGAIGHAEAERLAAVFRVAGLERSPLVLFLDSAGAKVSEGLIRNWWRQGMMSGVKASYECIKAFSETDFTEELKKFDVPTLILHGDDDQIVPIGASAMMSSKLVKGATLKVYPGLSHGLFATHHEMVNADILAFFQQHVAKVA